ncbi:metallo-beta-lactamase domain-containing protein 1 [Euwallacea fornicatus]|uniref:metallo-beta-lactamase domain-containing protein 1 n=1 Tax=Euwallacea fornicatus TaxID=995702 RepID=UPI00338F1006
MNKSDLQIIVLFSGYSEIQENTMNANCTCTLIKGPPNCIIDTMTAWDGSKIIEALHKHEITPNDINYVICTHGHSDHIGSNHLFQNAIHIVGFSVSQRDHYSLSPDIGKGENYEITDNIKVISTPGHTLQDVSVLVKINNLIYAITGDLFEKFEDLEDDSIWISAGSDNEQLQRTNRAKILKIANFIIPGHGPMFQVPQKYKVIKNDT